jgi:hypothetical protein
MNIFDGLTNLAANVVKVAVAPIEMVVDVTNAVVQPIAEAAEDLVEDVKSINK